MVLINDVKLEFYKAHLLSYEIGPCDMTDSYILPLKSMYAKSIKSTIGLRKITLTVDFVGESEGDAVMQMSNMINILRSGCDIYLPDGFYYKCVLDKCGKAVQTAPWIQQQTYSLSGFRHGPLVEKSLTSSEVIYVEGNCDTEAVIEISTPLSTITVNNITIKNITGKVIIDGMKKVVTQNGVNKYGDCDLTEFPVFSPGDNMITLSGAATIKISYYPIYL